MGIKFHLNRNELEKQIREIVKEKEIEHECPICKEKITFKLSSNGKTITCPHCKKQIHININLK